MFDDDVASSRQTLTKLYFEGDVEAMFKLMKEYTQPDKFKAMIIDRNIDMTNNMINEMHKHSLFSAVGAGHLGGDVGIVNLLRQKGYTVTPVNADFSGTASKYKSSGSAGKWYTFKSEGDGYTVEMPNAPVPLEMPGLPLKFQTYLDIGTLSFYMVASIPLGGIVEDQAKGKALDRMIDNISKGQKISGVKKIVIDGREGREFETQVDDNRFRVKVTIHRSNAYMMMVGPSRESANSNEAKRFFESLKLMTPVIATAKIESTLSKEGAFSVNMPGKVTTQVNTPTDPTSGKPIIINVMIGTNSNTGETFFVRYNDFPVSYVSRNDSTYFYGTLNAVYTRMGGINLVVKDEVVSGYPAKHFSFQSADFTFGVEGVLTMRGERLYMLMNTHSAKEPSSPDSKEFYRSFRFIPFQEPVLKEVSFPEGFSLNVPSTFEADSIISKIPDTETMYSFIDRLSGMMFFIESETFTKYTEYESPDKFFTLIMKKHLANKKGTLVKDSTISGKFPAREFVYKLPSTNALVRIRGEVAGNRMVTVWAYVPPNEDNLKLPTKVLASLKSTANSDWNLFSDKSDLILEGLLSRDSAERAKAKAALSGYEFQESQLPKVYKALKVNYEDDGAIYGYGTKGLLFDALQGKGGKQTQAFIEELYPSLSDTTKFVDKALGVLMSLKTKESVRKAMDLILANKSDHKFNGYAVLYPLKDSLALFNDVIPDVINSMSMFPSGGVLFEMLQTGLDRNTFSTANRDLVISKFTEMATAMADAPEGSAKRQDLYYVLSALFSVPFTPQVETLVRKFLLQESGYNKFLCFQLLLKNNAKVDAKDINRLAADPYLRLFVYEALRTNHKENLIDKKWLSSKMLAESELYQYISDEEDVSPGGLKLLKEKTVIEDGKKKKILVYTFDDAGNDVENDLYIAIAGTYDKEDKEFTRGRWTSTLWESYTNDKDLNTKLKKYLEQFDIKLVD